MQSLISTAYKQDALLLEEVMKERKSMANRERILVKAPDVPDDDGICRGKGMPEFSPTVTALRHHIERLEQSEAEAQKTLEKNFKSSPFATLVQNTPYFGIPMAAQLLGIIGDPYIKPTSIDIETGEILEPERKRTLAELFSYCGVTPGGVKKKGSKCKYNPQAQSTLWNIANAVQKCPPGKDVYLRNLWGYWKDEYKTRKDDNGKQWNGIRAMRAAHRKVGREILKMLYFESQRIHEGWEKSAYEFDPSFIPEA